MKDLMFNHRIKIYLTLLIVNILSVVIFYFGISRMNGAYVLLVAIPALFFHTLVTAWGINNRNEKLDILILLLSTILIYPVFCYMIPALVSIF